MIVDINLMQQDIRLEIDELHLEKMLELAEMLNAIANDLSNHIQLFCSGDDRRKCRRYFGELMGDIASDLIFPVNSVLEKDVEV